MHDLYLELFNKFGIPAILGELSWPVFPFIAVAALLVIVVIFLVLMERKVLAILTIRKGPNRVGPWGLFQTIADAIKLLFKEDIMSSKCNKLLFTLAPVIFFAPVMVIYGLIPFTWQSYGNKCRCRIISVTRYYISLNYWISTFRLGK